MQDTYFHRSLIYMLDHSKTGAWGVVINHISGMELSEVFKQMDIEPTDPEFGREEVLRGGPVELEHGLVLHPPGSTFESTREFDGGVSLSSSRDVIEALAAGQIESEHLVLLGHAGWAANQLEQEITTNAWLTCEADTDVIFHTPLSEKRDAVAGLIGIDINSIVGEIGHA